MKELQIDSVNKLLNEILQLELAGVVRYTQHALSVTGPYRMSLVDFLKEQAAESLTHAQQVGEILTGLGGRPSFNISSINENQIHSLQDILQDSLEHETRAVKLYKKLLEKVEGASVYLEEFVRGMISQEEMHLLELKKMLRDSTKA